MDKKAIIGLIIVMVVVVNIACNRQAERQEAEKVVIETPVETPRKTTEKTTEKAISSPVEYDIPEELRSRLDMPTFDKRFREYLIDEMDWTLNRDGELSMVAVKNDGWVQINFEDNSLMFDLQLQTQDREIVSCSVSNGEYYFEVEE